MTTYDDVNTAWPADLPLITMARAKPLAHKLFTAFAQGKAASPGWAWIFRGRRNWASAPGQRRGRHYGWPALVHDVSHVVHHTRNPHVKSHGTAHASLELEMIRHVLAQGWLSPPPAAKPKPALADRQQAELGRITASIERWEKKAKRADNALRKLRIRQRYYQRVASAAAAPV